MNPFRRASMRYGRTPEPETPYQKAAQVWDERIGAARVQAKNWRLMAFGSLILSRPPQELMTLALSVAVYGLLLGVLRLTVAFRLQSPDLV